MDYFKEIPLLNEYLLESIDKPSLELELLFGSNFKTNPIKKDVFSKLIDKLKDNFIYKGTTHRLDISCEEEIRNRKILSNVRCSINNIEDIKLYCSQDTFTNIKNYSYMKKKKYKDQLRNDNYNYRINLKEEIDLKDASKEVWYFKLNYEI